MIYAIRRALTAALVLTTSSTLLIGCSGTSTVDESAATTRMYGQDFSDTQIARLARSQILREIDPCALIDTAHLPGGSPVGYLGPFGSSISNELSQCTAVFGMLPGQVLPSEISVNLMGSRTEDDPVVVVIDGIDVTRPESSSSDSRSCWLQFPLALPAAAETTSTKEVRDRILPQIVEIKVDSVNDACSVAADTIRFILELAKAGLPERTADSVMSGLASHSPCEIAEHLPPGIAVRQLKVDATPFECFVSTEPPAGSIIDGSFTIRFGAYDLDYPDDTERIVRDGVSMTRKKEAFRCVTVAYGAQVDITVAGVQNVPARTQRFVPEGALLPYVYVDRLRDRRTNHRNCIRVVRCLIIRCPARGK